MNLFHNAANYAETISDIVFISSGILSWRLCKSTERVWNTVLFKLPHNKQITSREIGRTGWPRNVAINGVIFFGEVFKEKVLSTAALISVFLLTGVPLLNL
jgi:isoprenylcysteine carboxyl methyltransferase (ICMT) family protein YpbQ